MVSKINKTNVQFFSCRCSLLKDLFDFLVCLWDKYAFRPIILYATGPDYFADRHANNKKVNPIIDSGKMRIDLNFFNGFLELLTGR